MTVAELTYDPSLWLTHYDADVPHTLGGASHETLLDVVTRQSREHPDRVALRFEGAVVTYGQLLHQATDFAAALTSLGVRHGDRVALVLPNCPQFVVAQLGAWIAGAVVAPVNFTYPDDEMAALVARTGAKLGVVLSPFYERVKRIQAAMGIERFIVAFVRDALPAVKSFLFRLAVEKKQGHRATPRDGDLTMRELLARFAGSEAPTNRPAPSDPAVLLPSGGTTGTPKWVVGSHGGLATSGAQLRAWLGSVSAEGNTLLLPLPLFHVYALGGVQSLAFTGGYSLTLVANPRDMTGLLRTIRRDRPAFICAVPALLNGILAHKDAETSRDALRQLKVSFSGAAPLMRDTAERFQALTSGVIIEGYSLTEAQMAVVGNPVKGTKKIGSVGMPLPDVLLRIVDLETGTHDVPVGEPGEVLIAAPQLMLGFWDAPAETADMLHTDEHGQRWLYTGDIGFIDGDGYLFLTDRKKELIKVSGWQVWPREVEEAVASHPAVLEVGVAAIQHAIKGEVPKAWVVLQEGAHAVEDDIRQWCRERVAHYKVPHEVAFVDALPKTAVGKILRRKLQDL